MCSSSLSPYNMFYIELMVFKHPKVGCFTYLISCPVEFLEVAGWLHPGASSDESFSGVGFTV